MCSNPPHAYPIKTIRAPRTRLYRQNQVITVFRYCRAASKSLGYRIKSVPVHACVAASYYPDR